LFELFSAKQVEIIEKLLHNDPLSKTEREYYSRVIKKRLKALANPDVQSIASSLLLSSVKLRARLDSPNIRIVNAIRQGLARFDYDALSEAIKQLHGEDPSVIAATIDEIRSELEGQRVSVSTRATRGNTYVIFKRQLPKGLYRFMEIPTDNKHRPEAGLQSFDRLGNVHTEGRKIDSDFDGSSVLSEIMDGVRILGSVN
jgi:hypothetical protein